MSLTRTTADGASKPRRLVQLAVWVVFAITAVTMFSLSSFNHSAGASAPSSVTFTAAAGSAPNGTLVLAGGSGTSGVSQAGLYPISSVYTCTAKPGQTCSPSEDPTNLLPAYRWKDSLHIATDLGYGSSAVSGNLLDNFADMLFQVASWIWWLLLELIHYAVATDLVVKSGVMIDHAFSATVGGLDKAGLPIIIGVIAALMACARLLRGKVTQTISLIIGAAIILGGMASMAAAGAGSHGSGDNQSLNVGSPAWIATNGNAFINKMAGNLSTAFGAMGSVTGNGQGGTQATGETGGGPSCAQYNDNLTATYSQIAGTTSKDGTGQITAAALSQVSNMWQRSLYLNWTMAYYGNLPMGGRIACHSLENNLNTQSIEQFAVVGGAATNGQATSPGYAGMAEGPFFNYDGHTKTTAAQLWAWAACLGDNNAAYGWKQSMNGSDPRTKGNSDCHAWWTYAGDNKGNRSGDLNNQGINSGTGGQVFMWSDADSANSDTSYDGKPQNPTDLHSYRDALGNARSTVMAYWGHNSGTRLFTSLSAIISAVLFAVAFGAVSIGTIITQIGLLFLLCLLPFTLLMLALPNKDGGRNKVGVKLLKTTAGFLGGKLIFLGLLCAMVELMSILWSIVDGLTNSASSGLFVVWSMVIPLASIFILRMLVKAIGLGDIMSLSGAAGFATKAALATTPEGKKAGKGISNAAARAGAKSPFARALNRPLQSAAAKARAAARGQGIPTSPAEAWNKHKSNVAAAKQHANTAQDLSLAQAAMREGRLRPDLAAQVASGALSYREAQAINDGLLDRSLVNAVRTGRLTEQQAAQMTAGMRARQAQDQASADGNVGGFGGMRDRMHTAQGATQAGASAVFTDPVMRTGADHADLVGDRVAVTGARLEKLKGVATAQQWNDVAVAEAAGEFEALRAVAQGVAHVQLTPGGTTGAAEVIGRVGHTLSPAEVAFERTRTADAMDLPAHYIDLGNSGLRPTVTPAQVIGGKFNWPTNLTDDQLVTFATQGAHYVTQDVPANMNNDARHALSMLAQHSAGLIDANGVSAVPAMIKSTFGVDVETVTGRQELIDSLRGKSSRIQLESLVKALPEDEARIQQAVIKFHVPEMANQAKQVQVQQATTVHELSVETFARAQNVTESLQAELQNVLVAPSGSVNRAQAADTYLRHIESAIPALLADLGAMTGEAHLTRDWVANDKLNVDAIKQISEAGQAAVEDLQRELSSIVVGVKSSSGAQQEALLRQLNQYIADRVQAASSDLSEELDDLMRSSQRDAETRTRHLASQLSAPARGVDYSGGARDLVID